MEQVNSTIYQEKASKIPLTSAVQVRILGCKGMLVRDDSLESDKIILRDSMVKFKDKHSEETTVQLYILGYSQPKKAFADRQIQILLIN
jgi:hypothetical protein